MAFAGRPKAQNDPDAPLSDVGLIRMRDDARVEKRRALERILAGEIRADQQLPGFGQFTSAGKYSCTCENRCARMSETL